MRDGQTASGDACPHCGADGVGGAEGCNRLFQEVVGREFSRPELFQVHRLTVDTYSLQHPDQYMKSAKSAVAHLVGMCWAMEGSDDPSVALAVSRFLDGDPQFARPEPVPEAGRRGTLTILDIQGAATSAEHLEVVRSWAREAWEAWARHHDQARVWVEQARAGRGTKRSGRKRS